MAFAELFEQEFGVSNRLQVTQDDSRDEFLSSRQAGLVHH
jgi:hypothetical protein